MSTTFVHPPDASVLASDETFRLWRNDSNQWWPLVREIAAAERLSISQPVVFSTGTNLVVGLDAFRILKIYPPIYRRQYLSESATLKALAGRLHLPIPEIVAKGERDSWAYLCMTRLAGTVGSEIWPGLPEDQKERVVAEIGETIAAVQSVPSGSLSEIEPQWPELVEKQIAECRASHAAKGLSGKLLEDLDEILADAPRVVPLDGPRVILTGEYIPENFLLAEQNGRWRVAGLFDFGDVMTGWHEYDLLGPSAFMSAGYPRRVRALLEGYGYAPDRLDDNLRQRLFTLMLIHRASDLRNVAFAGWQSKIGHLRDLAGLIWPGE